MNKALAFALGLSLLCWFTFAPRNGVGLHNDDAQYLLSAQGLVSEGRYVDLSLPGHPQQTHFSPGYPILLALPAAIGGAPAAKFLSLLFILGSLVLLNRLFSKTLPARLLTFLGLIFASQPGTVYYSSVVMSEAAFLFFSLLTLNLNVSKPDNRRIAVLSGLTLFTSLIRPFGIFLAAALAFDLWQKKRRPASACILGTVAIGMMLYSAWNASGSDTVILSYSNEMKNYISAFKNFGAFISIWFSQLAGYMTLWATSFLLPINLFPWRVPAPLALLLGLAATGLAAAGVVRTRKDKTLRAAAIYTGLYFLAILFWRARAARYLFPIIPFLLLFSIIALKKSPRALFAALLAVNLAALGTWAKSGTLPSFLPPPIEREAFEWIASNAPNNAILASEKSATARLHTQRSAYPLLHGSTPDAIFSYLLKRGVTYVVLNPKQPLLHAAKGSSAEKEELARRTKTHNILAASPFLERGYGTPGQITVLRFKKSSKHYTQAHRKFRDGMTKFENKEYAQAAAILENAVSLDERLFTARYTLGYIYLQTGRLKKAGTVFLSLAEAFPGVPIAHLMASKSHGMANRMVESKAELNKAIESAKQTEAGIAEDAAALKESISLYRTFFGPYPEEDNADSDL